MSLLKTNLTKRQR